LGSHIYHHTKPHEYVKQKPQLAPVSSIASRSMERVRCSVGLLLLWDVGAGES
jgi:hypothetical protein